MADFNKVLTPGDHANGLVNAVIEIPKGSQLKVEWDRKNACFMLDRVEPGIFAKPVNYGFIPQTLDEDGDELDILVITDEPLTTGIYLESRIIGILNFVDDGEADYKIVAVPADDRHAGDRVKTIEDMGQAWMKQIEFHFAHYKDLKKPGTTVVQGWGNVSEAQKVIQESIARWNQQ